jgi:uncharacterized protein
MNLGTINTLTVLRESDISYILTDGNEEIFLHKKEALEPYADGDEIEVFLYTDNLGRVTASTKTPLLVMGDLALLKVVSVVHEFGVFVYYGMIKDLLLSKDDLPFEFEKWPRIDDHIFVGLKEKNRTLFAYLPTRFDMKKKFLELLPIEEGELVKAYCQSITKDGIICYTEFGHEIFVHFNNYREKKHLGELLEVKILIHIEDNKYTGTLIQQKEIMLEKDALVIYHYLEENGGTMPYTDKTDKDIIAQNFHMSKSAFKRGLGSLYKAKKVILEKNYTKILDK